MSEKGRSLYSLAARKVGENHVRIPAEDLNCALTPSMRLDLMKEMLELESGTDNYSSRGLFEVVEHELSNLDTFLSLLHVGHRRVDLHQIFSVVSSCKRSKCYLQLASCLSSVMSEKLCTSAIGLDVKTCANAINLAGFLMDGGWFPEASDILVDVEKWATGHSVQCVAEESRIMLLQVFCFDCKFDEAHKVYERLLTALNPHESSSSTRSCLPALYSSLSTYHFALSRYGDAYECAMRAVQHLNSDLPLKVVIDTLRIAGKACVVKRLFPKAEILMREAVLLCREVYGERHPKYADCLVDLGFYLLNVDKVTKSIRACRSALEIRKKIFGQEANLLTAIAYEELAYCTYVLEYNSGRFSGAKEDSERALNMMNKILPGSHLLLASAKRVLALILEEIAIDERHPTISSKLLLQSEQLHLSALKLSIEAFGETNVQTAKHYGNLGRLYQSMKLYDIAREMHSKAISIKEELLGPDDYDVALSVGHLASLYNYDLGEYRKAEELYHRSIRIGEKLFGPEYSGLEYDYRGLINVYHETKDLTKFMLYHEKLLRWKSLRDESVHEEEQDSRPILNGSIESPLSIDAIVNSIISDFVSTRGSLSNNAEMSTSDDECSS